MYVHARFEGMVTQDFAEIVGQVNGCVVVTEWSTSSAGGPAYARAVRDARASKRCIRNQVELNGARK